MLVAESYEQVQCLITEWGKEVESEGEKNILMGRNRDARQAEKKFCEDQRCREFFQVLGKLIH